MVADCQNPLSNYLCLKGKHAGANPVVAERATSSTISIEK